MGVEAETEIKQKFTLRMYVAEDMHFLPLDLNIGKLIDVSKLLSFEKLIRIAKIISTIQLENL